MGFDIDVAPERDENNGYEHTGERPFLRYFAEGQARIGSDGDFARKLEKSIFANSEILKKAGSFAEKGLFEEGVKALETELEKRRIELVYEPHSPRGTRKNGEEWTMVMSEDYPSYHPARQMMDITHRNMSIILQRSGIWNRENLLKLFIIDIAFTEAIRCGAQKFSDNGERIKALREADELELNAREKIFREDISGEYKSEYPRVA